MRAAIEQDKSVAGRLEAWSNRMVPRLSPPTAPAIATTLKAREMLSRLGAKRCSEQHAVPDEVDSFADDGRDGRTTEIEVRNQDEVQRDVDREGDEPDPDDGDLTVAAVRNPDGDHVDVQKKGRQTRVSREHAQHLCIAIQVALGRCLGRRRREPGPRRYRWHRGSPKARTAFTADPPRDFAQPGKNAYAMAPGTRMRASMKR